MPVIPGQLQTNKSPSGGEAGPQLCLKFVKATGPDGKPGLTAILGASPTQPPGDGAVQTGQAVPKRTPVPIGARPNTLPGTIAMPNPFQSTQAPRMQTPIPQQPQRVMQLTGPSKRALVSSQQTYTGKGLPTQVPFPVAIRPSQDETQAAVDALLASTSNTSEGNGTKRTHTTATSGHSEPRIANWKNRPRTETRRKQDLAKTEKLLNALRSLMSQQKAQVEQQQKAQVQEKSESQVSQSSPLKSVRQTSPFAQTSAQSQASPGQATKLDTKMSQSVVCSNSQPNTNSESETIKKTQSEIASAVSLQQPSQAGPRPGPEREVTNQQMETSMEEVLDHPRTPPHQLPPDEDRLGLDQTALRRKQKLKGKQSRKRVKRIRQVSPDEAMDYLENISSPKRTHTKTAQEIEAREWNNMIRNIDIFMFPVYRCKLCPNYYTTVKPTMVTHMKEVHRWPKAEGKLIGMGAPKGDGNTEQVDDNIQTRVHNIQAIFERKLRNQKGYDVSGEGDVESIDSQTSSIEIPFHNGSPQLEGEPNGSIDREAANNDDDDVGGGKFEDVDVNDDDDDDYDVGEGGFEEDDEDEENNTAQNFTGGVRKSARLLVKLSSTPMIRKYHHTKRSSISPQIDKNLTMKMVAKDQEKTNGKDNYENTEGDGNDQENYQTKSWPQVLLTQTPVQKALKEKITNRDNEMKKSAKAEEELEKGRHFRERRERYVEDNDEEEANVVEEVDEESSEEEVDKRDLNEVRPKYQHMIQRNRCALPRKKKSSRRANKKKGYFKPGNLHFTKRAGYKSAIEKEELQKQASETGEGISHIKLPPLERPKTRSVTRLSGGLDCDSNMMDVAQGKNRVRISRYEAWKKIGLDPNSEPPWPCTHKGCGYYFASLGSVLAHHIWKHDTFGDRNQRILARDLGEKYSLFEKHEKRAIEGAKISVDDENKDGESGVVKSKRKKKPVKRLANVIVGKNKNFIPKKDQKKSVKKKKIQCKYCRRFFATLIHMRMHMRRMHKSQWMKDNNLTQEDLDEITKNVEENQDDTSANISLLATVADKLEDRVNLDCKQCSYKAVSEKTLRYHRDQAHPEYIRSFYSDDSEGEEANVNDNKQIPDVSPSSSRPVRKCRRKALPKLLQKEKKLDKIIPLPHEESTKEISDDDGNDGGDELPRSGTSLQCTECNYIAVADKNFVNHMRKVHQQEVVLNYQCEHCDFMGTRRELTSHIKSHIQRVICDMCGKSFQGEKRLKMHQAYRCRKERPQKKKPNMHVKRTCQICHKEFHNLGTYHYHMSAHRTDQLGETFECNLCSRTFRRKASVRAHIISVHTEGKIQCDHCSFKCQYQSKLREHLFEKHNIGGEDLPEIKCTFEGCSFTTKSKIKLASHKKKHNVNRFKYWCDGCNQGIRTLKCLARHQVLHRDGVNKYKCKECGYQASNSNTLSSHKRSKHPDPNKVIICDLCGDSFNKRASLMYHKKMKHTQENLSKCKFCDQTFKYYSQVSKHMKEDHQDLMEAEESAQMEEAKKIINALPKTRAKSSGPRKRKYRPKPPTGRKIGRPKVPLTPELIARREELKRARNKRKYETRKAKMKSLGLKRKKYPRKKGQAARTSSTPQKQGGSTVSKVDSNDGFSDDEVTTAAQQLENIAQAFTAQPQKMSPYKSPAITEFPVHVEHTQNTYGELTALNHEFQHRASTSGGTLHVHPPTTTQEVEVPTDIVAGGSNTGYQTEMPVSTTQRIVPAPVEGQMMTDVRPGEQPASYLEVTTVHSDGRRHVEMWPVWQS